MPNEREQKNDSPGWIAKVVGGAIAVIAIGAVKHADDLGRAVVLSGAHSAPGAIERSVASGGDDAWRASRAVMTAPMDNAPPISEDSLYVAQASNEAAEQSETAVARYERDVAERAPTIAGHVGEIASEVGQEAVESLLQEGVERLTDDENSALAQHP